MTDKFFQVAPEASAVGSLMSLTVIVRTIIFHSEKFLLDRLQAPYSWLVLDGTKDFVYGELQWGKLLFRPEGSE